MLASDPPQLDRFMQAVAQVESHGSPTALNAKSGAYGRYQIMPDNWRAWARRYLGNANAKPTLANQERVARAKMAELYRWLGSWERVSYWWLTGSSQTTAWSNAARQYVARVMAIFGGIESTTPSVETLRHYSERSSTITYAGAWHVARASGYVGGRVTYASGARRLGGDHLHRQPDRLVRAGRTHPRQGTDHRRRHRPDDRRPQPADASNRARCSSATAGRQPGGTAW